jgi:hypothetical protein
MALRPPGSPEQASRACLAAAAAAAEPLPPLAAPAATLLQLLELTGRPERSAAGTEARPAPMPTPAAASCAEKDRALPLLPPPASERSPLLLAEDSCWLLPPETLLRGCPAKEEDEEEEEAAVAAAAEAEAEQASAAAAAAAELEASGSRKGARAVELPGP